MGHLFLLLGCHWPLLFSLKMLLLTSYYLGAPMEDKVPCMSLRRDCTNWLWPLRQTPALVAPQARTTWHALVSGADEKCIWDKSCLRKKTWGLQPSWPPQSILCSLCNKLGLQEILFLNNISGGTWESAPPSSVYTGFICLLKIFQCSEAERDFSTLAILINSA